MTPGPCECDITHRKSVISSSNQIKSIQLAFFACIDAIMEPDVISDWSKLLWVNMAEVSFLEVCTPTTLSSIFNIVTWGPEGTNTPIETSDLSVYD